MSTERGVTGCWMNLVYLLRNNLSREEGEDEREPEKFPFKL